VELFQRPLKGVGSLGVSAHAPFPARVVGIGASAGGIEALLKVLAALAPDFPHSICVVVHLPAAGGDMLGQVLDRRCSIHVGTARDGEPLRPGQVYVAPANRHLVVRGSRLALTADPLENGVRPAVDPLLRSLAEGYGPAAVAVVLSGALTDGAHGARSVADAGGRVLVQDPADARVSSMPRHAIEEVGDAAEVLPAEAIGTELAQLPDRPLLGAGA
jgi:two-component system, chemotaxis family, protein-glutamate methylesterase/glutaminase